MEHGCQSKPANSRWHRRQGCEGRWHFSRAPGTPGRGTCVGKGKEAGKAQRRKLAKDRAPGGSLPELPRASQHKEGGQTPQPSVRDPESALPRGARPSFPWTAQGGNPAGAARLTSNPPTTGLASAPLQASAKP